MINIEITYGLYLGQWPISITYADFEIKYSPTKYIEAKKSRFTSVYKWNGTLFQLSALSIIIGYMHVYYKIYSGKIAYLYMSYYISRDEWLSCALNNHPSEIDELLKFENNMRQFYNKNENISINTEND
jgi:hypothetical protein